MKKITFLVLLSFVLLSANMIFAQENANVAQVKPANIEGAIVSPENFQDFAANNVGKEVEVKGMVVHVCQHGGKKMFIIGDDPDKRVKIDASEKVSVFKPELEGSTVVVQGTIQPIVEEEVPESEKATQDADHSNYYHKPQYSISCLTIRTVEE